MSLSNFELFLGACFHAWPAGGRGLSINPNASRIAADILNQEEKFHEINKEIGVELSAVISKARAFEHPKMNISSMVDMYQDVDMINNRSPFKFLGYFSIIESIITHEPKSGDASITKQVTKKMSLLNKRFVLKINYDEYFKEKNIDTIWKKLYAYRSAIAHGTEPQFVEGSLSILKSSSNSLKFIRLACRSLMRQVIEEPDLIYAQCS